MKKDYRSELFLGLVAPVGIDLNNVETLMNKCLIRFDYSTHTIRLSSLTQNIGVVKTKIDSSSEYSRIGTGMQAGNEARAISGQCDILAKLSIIKVQNIRISPTPKPDTAYIFRSIKNPHEALLYRTVYDRGFFLLGFYSSRQNKIKYLIEHGMTKRQANELINRDEQESEEYGQQTRNTFYTSDVFFDVDSDNFESHLNRFFDLIFGNPYITPTRDEFAMFLAFTSSFRSADLSRQVGAVVSSEEGEIIATGCNDVPKKSGGLYWPGDSGDKRDFVKRYDSNEIITNGIIFNIISGLKSKIGKLSKISQKDIISILKDAGLLNITEYGRAVHAEMEALLTCARVGISPRGGTLYSTTFPCHNCAKHIVASGIERVVFVEPYAKSRALQLHADSIEMKKADGRDVTKVVFETFIGIGPRRFIDLFSISLSNGVKIVRKQNGRIVNWIEKIAIFRFPLVDMSYLDKEKLIGAELMKEKEDAKKRRKK